MRGKQNKHFKRARDSRITPAYAGKTTPVPQTATACRDHPRVCGENQIQTTDRGKGQGSPPRMRGKLSFCPPVIRPAGITPADAGKTYRKTCRFCINQDHPRGCGENKNTGRRRIERLGSPPRMRGKPDDRTVIIGTNGITPADAGKTVLLRKSNPQGQDHPRGCGENNAGEILFAVALGSPPRMRGKLERGRRKPH